VVSISGASIVEGNAGRRPLIFAVALSSASALPVSVRWGVGNGTAVAGRDYVAAAGSVTFAPGETRRTITVFVLGDRLAEGDETFRVGLASPLRAVISAAAGRATGTIRDDDGPARLAAAFAGLAGGVTEPAVATPRRPKAR